MVSIQAKLRVRSAFKRSNFISVMLNHHNSDKVFHRSKVTVVRSANLTMNKVTNATVTRSYVKLYEDIHTGLNTKKCNRSF